MKCDGGEEGKRTGVAPTGHHWPKGRCTENQRQNAPRPLLPAAPAGSSSASLPPGSPQHRHRHPALGGRVPVRRVEWPDEGHGPTQRPSPGSPVAQCFGPPARPKLLGPRECLLTSKTQAGIDPFLCSTNGYFFDGRVQRPKDRLICRCPRRLHSTPRLAAAIAHVSLTYILPCPSSLFFFACPPLFQSPGQVSCRRSRVLLQQRCPVILLPLPPSLSPDQLPGRRHGD